MGFLKDVFGSGHRSSCCDVKIQEVKPQEAELKEAAKEAANDKAPCCSTGGSESKE